MGKAEIFAAIRAALADVREPDPAADVAVPWEYGQATAVEDVVGLFAERVEDYKATVLRAASADAVGDLVAQALAEHGAGSVAVPAGVPEAWYAAAERAGVAIRRDDPPLTNAELNETAAVLTAAAVGWAETGTIALDHRADQGRRALTLVPDLHVCVIEAAQIVTDVPEAMARLQASLNDRQPITWISGPSATSDIELSRVEGVHGPRTLIVIVVG
ncbi:MAG: LUD domain-containing protein [Propionibacteriaceae bacterium]|jgi:L-lactate dehydrogenase complex protein LldG|nr:LUD domain-containing protein [Propionibacteriaceae bacterium]